MALLINHPVPRDPRSIGEVVKGITDLTGMARNAGQLCDLAIGRDLAVRDMIHDFVYAGVNYSIAHETFICNEAGAIG